MQPSSRSFIYTSDIKWTEGKKGVLSSPDKPVIEVATPVEFGGPSGVWSPEDLLVSSVNSCVMTTFLYYIKRHNLSLVSYKSTGKGILEKKKTGLSFSSIQINPEIQMKKKSDIPMAEKLLKLSKERCLISNSIKEEVILNIQNIDCEE